MAEGFELVDVTKEGQVKTAQMGLLQEEKTVNARTPKHQPPVNEAAREAARKILEGVDHEKVSALPAVNMSRSLMGKTQDVIDSCVNVLEEMMKQKPIELGAGLVIYACKVAVEADLKDMSQDDVVRLVQRICKGYIDRVVPKDDPRYLILHDVVDISAAIYVRREIFGHVAEAKGCCVIM
jgi:hypothetical protein